jgi:transposase
MNRRGVKPGRNREVISGILHVLKFGCRWRDCPEIYGPHTTIYNRFNRWSKAGLWEAMRQRLVTIEAADLQCIDSTTSKAHRCSAGGEGGADEQAIGRSRGGRTAKIHAVADRAGRLIAFDLTPGQRGDIRPAAALLATCQSLTTSWLIPPMTPTSCASPWRSEAPPRSSSQTRRARMFRPSIKPFTGYGT